MTIIISIVIISILCGVIFALMWASSHSLYINPRRLEIKVLFQPENDAKELEASVIYVYEELVRLDIEPEILISEKNLSDAGRKNAKSIADRYGFTIVTGDELWDRQRNISG